MSKSQDIIKKYAQVLYNVAIKEYDINQISINLNQIRKFLKSVPELNQLLMTHSVQIKDKIKILNNIFSKNFFEIELIELLLENAHFIHFQNIVKRFDYLIESDSDITKVQLISAKKLSNDDINSISSIIKEKLNNKINIETKVDKTIIGGIKLRIDNTLIDSSVSSRINKIRDALMQV